jgi:hypothetical protein
LFLSKPLLLGIQTKEQGKYNAGSKSVIITAELNQAMVSEAGRIVPSNQEAKA